MNNLSFEELFPGMEIIDEEGYTGVIMKCTNIKAIVVKLTCCTGGYMFYCLDPKNEKFEKIYKKETSE